MTKLFDSKVGSHFPESLVFLGHIAVLPAFGGVVSL